MIKFILPNGFNLIKNNTDLILNNNYNNLFWGIETQIPFMIFNGRINNNISSIFFSYDNIVDVYNSYGEISNNMIIFDCGNLLLEEKDYENAYGEVLFKEFSNKKNAYFAVADINFMKFLIKEYPTIQIILHENYTIFHDDNDINKILKSFPNNIKAINITILHLCENIEIAKIGILNLDSCYYCPQFPLCLNKENNNILRYREASIFIDCLKKKMIISDNVQENLKTLLKYTDIIQFEELPGINTSNYFMLINEVLEKEKEIIE